MNRLKELREEKRLSQKEMAIAEKTRRAHGVDTLSSRIEEKKQKIKVRRLVEI